MRDAGLGVAALAVSGAASGAVAPILKVIPSTGERLPAIGLGTIWFRNAQYEALRDVISRLHDGGGKLIDTAAAYGESEGVIGRAMAELGLRDALFVATKFDAGRSTSPQAAAPPAAPAANPLPGPPSGITRPEADGVGGQASFARSLQRLETDRVDLLQVHGMNGTDALMPLLLDYKRAGRIRYIGVTTSNPQQHGELAETMRRHPLDFIQVDYSIGNRSAEAEVLPLARRRGIAVLVNLPLGRATLLKAAASRPLPRFAADLGIASWAQFLLKYVISHPAVTCAVPGVTQAEHMVANLAAGRGVLPDSAMRQRMEAAWMG